MKATELRKSILQAAVEGKLVPQDPNDEPASVLLEHIKKGKDRLIRDGKIKKGNPLSLISDEEQLFKLPKGWNWCRLSDICIVITDGDHQPPPKTDSGIPFLVISNVSKGYLDFSNTRYVPQSYFDALSDEKIAAEGDILFTVTGSFGIPIIVDGDKAFCFQRHIALIRATPHIDLTYLHTYLLSPCCYNQCVSVATGTAQKTVPLSGIRNLMIPIPPLCEQQRISTRVVDFMKLCDKLEKSEKELELLESQFVEYLPKSVLQAAVQGKLVAQDPNDEPATELLKRIKQEKEGLIRNGKIKKDKPMPPISEDKIPYDLPEGWTWCRFAEIIELISGRDLEKNQYNDENKGIPYITGASALDGETVLVNRWTDTQVVVSQFGDILLSCKGTVGKIVTNHIGDCHIARQIMALRIFSELVSADYIKLFLQSYVVQLNIKAKSIIPGISRDDVLHAYCPLPPLAEQHRIVAKIDELMTMCNELKSAHTLPVLREAIDVANIIPFPQKSRTKPIVDSVTPIGIAARGNITDGLSEQASRDADELLGDD
ncbi:MAG: restriction endonuclease subunit S [Defluviitaleaceae bacterium]|nr:restriction endonuclease subunit S [Defluviitaleaceae bacterium]